MANLVMTVVEAQVPDAQWSALEDGFGRLGTNKPSQLVASYLTQSAADPSVWRLMGLWQSREAFEAYRSSVAVPGALMLFRSVGVEPTVALFDVKGQQGN